MRTKEEIRGACAKLLASVRQQKGWSKSKMAQEMFVDAKTWARYESGESMPSVAEFLYIFEQLGADCLPALLQFLYPAQFDGLGKHDADGLREGMANYLRNVASDRLIITMNYLLYGNHGSNIEAQVQELLMLDHLPLVYRYAAAVNLQTYWDIAQSKGEILQQGDVMPNVALFTDALEKARTATISGVNGYAAIVGSNANA